jgi:hypothetical protein
MQQENTFMNYSRVILGVRMMSPRLSFLDSQRILSMADEGGVSAAKIEGDESAHVKKKSILQKWMDSEKMRGLFNSAFLKKKFWWISGGVASAGLGFYFMRSRKNIS